MSCLDACAPLVTKAASRPAAPWLTEGLRVAVRQRDDTRTKLRRDRHNICLQKQYANEKKEIKSPIGAAKIKLS